MSDNSDRPDDWLDELYQADNNDGPPADLDASIRAAARNAHGVRPWYKRTRTLASVATLALALGISALWLGAPQDQATLSMAPAPMPAQETLADSAALVSDVQHSAEEATPKDSPASPEASRARRVQELEKSAARTSTQHIAEVLEAAPATGPVAHMSEGISSPEPDSCTTWTLVDVGERVPYAVCHQDARNPLVNHPDCSAPYSLATAVVEADEHSGSLIVVMDGQRTRLRCDPKTDSWVTMRLADEN